MALKKSSLLVLSSPMQVDLALYKGDTGKFRITVTDDLGAPVNISGATWDSDIRINAADPGTPVANFTITPVAGDSSSVDVSIAAAITTTLAVTTYFYDLQMTLSGVVTTLMNGSLIVTQDVSR
jgi:hypothetical protein